jgi:hypothetical protein
VLLHCPISPWVPCKGVYYTTIMARGPCPLRSGWCLDLLAWITLNNFLFIRGTSQEQTVGLLITGCWAVWLHVWHPWLIFKTSFIPRDAATRGPCFVTLTVPNQFRYPVLGEEPGCLNWHTHDTLLAEWWIFTLAYYYAEGTSGHAVKCPVLWLDFLRDQSAVYRAQILFFFLGLGWGWWLRVTSKF